MCVAISRVYAIIESQPNIVCEENVYKDTERKVALLRYSAAFNVNSGYTREKQGWDMPDGYKYFLARKSIAVLVSQFFNAAAENMEYSLLVDCTTYIHSCMLFIRRKQVTYRNQPSYIFNAFDPNTTCISECFSKVAKEIAAVSEINVWAAKHGNADGLCFGLNWRFIYSIMCEGHNPLENEKIVGRYNPVHNTATYGIDKNSISSIGYFKRKRGAVHFYFRPKKITTRT